MAKSAKPVTAFVMMTIAPGESHNVVKSLKRWTAKKQGQSGAYVKGAWVVTGDHDAIAMVEADTNEQLLQLITDMTRGLRQSPGPILSTRTAIAADGLWG